MGDEKFTRESTWRSYDGTIAAIKDLEDSHILNILTFLGIRLKKALKHLDNIDTEDAATYALSSEIRLERVRKEEEKLAVINAEIELRHLDKATIPKDRSLPFKKDGVWMEWVGGANRPTPILNSVGFIKGME